MKARWELSGQGEMSIPLSELSGLPDDDIETWIMDGVQIEVYEQGNFAVRITNLTDVIRYIRENEDAEEE